MSDDQEGDLTEFKQMDELDELRKVNERLQRQNRQLRAKTVDLVEAVYNGAKDAATIAGPAKQIPAPKPDKRKKRAEVCWAACTDWHFGASLYLTNPFRRVPFRFRWFTLRWWMSTA